MLDLLAEIGLLDYKLEGTSLMENHGLRIVKVAKLVDQ